MILIILKINNILYLILVNTARHLIVNNTTFILTIIDHRILFRIDKKSILGIIN